ncbi:alpha-ketoglutarate decarboxylase [Robertkochia solimangrovi]|uniref:alpha-ketoglutarate decarboxylase n=1 Tax=Robertkochia solimangrovi TaxID=2213046 RepID=UPI00117C958A|nr:alpha-ketoglutarate decarboxylase [Robertkochia solimangrovi]TRZ46356.1 alpha-ketoglutarate decarboxylase [Robertkochia solimangrovi]
MKIYNITFLKWYLPLILFFSTTFFLQAQNYAPQPSRIHFGGNIGLGFGDGFFSGTIAPSAIYQFNPQFAAGAGLNFTWANQRDFYKSTIMGGSLIGIYTPIRELQLSGEFEELYVQRNYDSQFFADEDYWYPALFLGAGYNTGPITVGIRYDVLYDEDKSIYGNAWMPFIRVYF